MNYALVEKLTANTSSTPWFKTKPWIKSLLSLWFIAALASPAYANDAAKKAKLDKTIKKTQATIAKTQSETKQLGRKINSTEDSLNASSNKLENILNKSNALSSKINALLLKQDRVQKQVDLHKHALAQQMLALYSSGNQTMLRMLLRQNNPSEISRNLKYYEYLNKARLNKINTHSGILNDAKETRIEIEAAREEMQSLKLQHEAENDKLKRLLSQRKKILGQKKGIIESEKSKLAKLKKERRQLIALLERLRRAQAEKERKRRARKRTQSKNPKNVDVHDVPNLALAKLKGRLSWPVKGRIIHDYYSNRNSIQRWDGVVIEAKGGSRVRAIAKGEVIFADRYPGHGYLIIIQHDSQHISLYGYNRALFKKRGQRVNAGDAIAAVGNNGSLKNNAVYFQIRRGSRFLNPAQWCK